MTRTSQRLLNVFVTGILAALPLAATTLIFVWGARLVVAYVGPNSLIGGLLVRIGLGITGSEVVGYAIGVAVVMAALFLLGLLVQTRLREASAALFHGIVQRIPVVRSIYDLIEKFVDLLAQRNDDGLRSMRPVWLHFGGVGGAAVLGLLSTPEPVRMGDIDYLAVLVPTAPVPIGGGLLYVPSGWVTPAEIGIEGLTSIYVSMGITSQQHLRRAA
jgi:uncharacterized membrane protein